MSTRAKPEIELAVMERDSHSCIVCGLPVAGTRGYHWSIHHRQPRGMGGTKNRHINLPSNLVVVCGHGTYGCHGRIERERARSYDVGYLVRRPAMPAREPILITNPTFPDGTWMWLTDDGEYADFEPELKGTQ